MGRPISIDLRQRMIGFVQAGHSAQAAARQFMVAPRTAINLVNRWRTTGKIEALKAGRRSGSVLDTHQDWLREQVSRLSPSSRPTCARPQPELSRHSGAPSQACSLPSRQPNAQTSSLTPDMRKHCLKTL